MHPRIKLLSGKDANSKESDEVCFEFASTGSKESTTSRLLEPYHQDLTEKPKERSLQRKRDSNPSPTSLQMRGDLISVASKERNPTIYQERPSISGKDTNSKESDAVCFEFASKGSKESIPSSLIEPFHQDFNEKSHQQILSPPLQDLSLHFASTGSKESTTSRLIEPYYQELTEKPKEGSPQRKRDSNPSYTSLQMRGDLISVASKERNPIICQTRSLISGKDTNSKESDAVCFELASKGSTESNISRLIEPFHQDLNEKPDQQRLSPPLQDLSLQKKRDSNPSFTSLQMRGDPDRIETTTQPPPIPHERKEGATSFTPTTTIMNNGSSEEESSDEIPANWELSRMRGQRLKRNGKDTNQQQETHQETTNNQLNNIPTIIVINNEADSRKKELPLTSMERAAIKAQDAIGWEHFIRGRSAKAFGPVIQNYYKNNKIKSFSAHLKWSNAINKCLFSIHQSAWKNYCAEIASPVRTTKSTSQRKLYLLSLVEKYYDQAADLPKLQSQWFARPIVKYQKWRVQELLNWLRTAKRILRTKGNNKKDLSANSKKKAVYTILNNTKEEKSPMTPKNRIHTIHTISTKEELSKMRTSFISTYFTTRDKQLAEQTEQTTIQTQDSSDSICSIP